MNKLLSRLSSLSSQKVFLMAALLGGGYYSMFFDAGDVIKSDIANLQGQLSAETEKKKDTDATLLEEKRMKEAVGILSDQYQIISKKLPTQLSELEINGALEGYARETQVRIKASRPGVPEKLEIVQEVPWEIVLEGKFANIMQFVGNVSSAERLTRVKSLSLGPSKESGGTPQNILRFEGVVVGYKLAVEDAKGATKR
jgi:type IV pilus assembly protein PilO